MFLEQSNDRRLPADYRGDVLVFDIDKTYLDTSFSSFRGLIAIPLEFAIDKSSLPGAVHLIRALRHGPGPTAAITPLYFVSGSPPQLRKVIEQKMTLDGVHFDGITFKDQWGLLRAGRPRDIRAQVGYKLQALLLYRRELPDGARYLMFGDDVEEDAESFLLFGEICAGLRDHALEKRLESHRVSRADIHEIVRIASTIPITEDPVERVFIILTRTEPSRYAALDRVVAARSYLQAALVLVEMGKIQPEAISAVARDLRRHRISESLIAEQLHDAESRLGIGREQTRLARQ
jgi:hypothetical protein